MTDLTPIKFYVTPEQAAAIAAACQNAALTQSEFIRDALAAHCQRYAAPYPENMRPRGNHSPLPRRKKKVHSL